MTDGLTVAHAVQLLAALLTGGFVTAFVNARVAAHRATLDERKESLDELRGIIAEQREYIKHLETRLDALTQRVGALECENAEMRRELGR